MLEIVSKRSCVEVLKCKSSFIVPLIECNNDLKYPVLVELSVRTVSYRVDFFPEINGKNEDSQLGTQKKRL